jgi:hypothetical protein
VARRPIPRPARPPRARGGRSMRFIAVNNF